MLAPVKPGEIKDNLINLISKDWMLITAGDESGYNTMTASWGFAGHIWERDAVSVVLRPQRYTTEFVDRNELFTCTFLRDEWRTAHGVCGSKSGREVDKAKETGLTPAFGPGYTYFEQAKLVLVCKKIYRRAFTPADFLDPSIEKHYPEHDYHIQYIGEITEALALR